ncbi:MAG: POTRA domain-containing protein [Kofleriaceae bacterium]
MKAVVVVLAIAACGGTSKPLAPPTPASKPAPPGGAAVAATTTWDQLKGPIKSVEVPAVGDAGLRTQVAAVFAEQTGKLLDRAKLRDALENVLAIPVIADVAARGVQLAGGIKLIIDVKLQPTVRKLTAVETGGKDVPFTGLATPRTGGPLDRQVISGLVADLREKYITRGYMQVIVDWHQVPVAGGVDVVIDITQGEASTVESITVSGNKGVATPELVATISKFVVVGQPVLAERIERASLELSALYWERGYANVSISAPEITGGSQKIVYTVREGGVFKIGAVTISGDPPAKDHARYLQVFGVKKGDVFKRSAIVDGRERVLLEAAAAGMKTPNALPLTKVDLTKQTIDITLEIIKSQ